MLFFRLLYLHSYMSKEKTS